MKLAIICAGGPEADVLDLKVFAEEDVMYVGADRGAVHLLSSGIIPDAAIGDFDSVTDAEYNQILESVSYIEKADSEKDQTDTELAVLHALSFKPDRVILTGVTGGRLDHMEAALHLMHRLQEEHKHIKFMISNQTNEISILRAGVHRINRDERYPFISFFSFVGPVKKLTLTGFKYETVDATLEIGTTKFTSNETASEVCTISFREGICLMVRSSDS
ncbi:thiamine diphosphokinase [Bacillus sp. OxB-1]|uniref:thiamine diphosphokinase n=1 Tax=Bacillus sp. (strain OxB-1) TaxID=98228 RepID=UPI00058203A8|nr:thiamine diphosphokinase [Bacillus sp. OxB-1]BAQ10473.1 thiamine diphosphokinase [Bacillus sp. OxB-1]